MTVFDILRGMDIANMIGLPSANGSWNSGALIIFIGILLWSLVWKGAALWTASRRGERIWFIVFLIVNTLGILEIVYLLFLTKEQKMGDKLMLSDTIGKQM